MNELILRRRWLFGVLVALTALLSSASTLRNGFVQDDVPLVVDDDRVADPGRWDEYLNEAYWPAPLPRDLYRPLTSLLIGVEWWAGNGAPVTYKVMQVTFYLASCIAVFALALRLLVPWAAVATGLFFAIHPVHVEAVALAVNQAEVLVGLLSAMTVAWYIGRRRSGPLTAREHAGLAAATLVVAHVKESGVMLPVLLFCAETILSRDAWRQRVTPAISLIVWQTLAVVVTIALRLRVPFEYASGSFVGEAFEHEPIWGRFMTMLRIVPEWLRLLLWPASLSADYSPGLIVPATSWGIDQTLGLAILVLLVVLAWRLRKTTPVATFGIAWCAAGLFPVHNVLIPTGIAVAERTLFLPSIGAMLMVGALVSRAPRLFATRPMAGRWVVGSLCALVITLGATRSYSRHQVWYNSNVMWGQAVIDNPDGYRPRMALGSLLDKAGWRGRAIELYRQSIQLWDRHWGADFQLAVWFREMGDCHTAAYHDRRVLRIREVEPARLSLVTCLAWIGEYEEAKSVALKGIGGEQMGPILRIWYRTVDSAAKVNAPRYTVTFPRSYREMMRTRTTPGVTP